MSVSHTHKQDDEPRYEFRSFGQHFEYASKRMARLSEPVPEELWERCSEEIYIVSLKKNFSNVKIRDNKMEIKLLLNVTDEFEQWKPILKTEFPLTTSALKDEICTALQVQAVGLLEKEYSLDELLAFVNNHPYLQYVTVKKQRAAYLVNKTICETGTVLINGAKVSTISCESVNINDLKKTIKDVGLDGIENINYPEAIQRVISIAHKPLAN